jgi:hypothetical protein
MVGVDVERIYAAIDGNTITNTFVGDDAFADLVRPDHDEVVEITDLSPFPGVAWTVDSDGYRPPTPFPSWVWDEAAVTWIDPSAN